jgi:hypothetical protein
MALKAYEEFAEEPLAFPIGGKVYAVPPVSYLTGIRLTRLFTGEDHSLDGKPAEEGWKLILGAAWDEMAADDVPMDAMSRAGLAAIANFQFGREAAERVWEANISPEALAAAVAANRKERRAKPTRSSSTAAGAKTRARASTSGTRTSRTTSGAKGKASQS